MIIFFLALSAALVLEGDGLSFQFNDPSVSGRPGHAVPTAISKRIKTATLVCVCVFVVCMYML